MIYNTIEASPSYLVRGWSSLTRSGALRSITLSLRWTPIIYREIAASEVDSGLSLLPCGGSGFP